MSFRLSLPAALIAFVVLIALGSAPAVSQQLTDMFGVPISVAPDFGQEPPRTQLNVTKTFISKTFCVRTCDGRYYSVASSEKSACQAMCPSAETKLYRGSSIETSTGPDGKSYAKAKNAFRFRNEFVESCSCLSNSSTGISHVRIEDDTTIRNGDIVADVAGLMVASSGSGSRVTFRPIAKSRLRAEKLPAVASY